MRHYIILFLYLTTLACSTGIRKNQATPSVDREVITTNQDGKGTPVTLELFMGESFYYPLMAIWLEDVDSNYIQTLFVAKSVAEGVFKYGRQEKNRWVEAPKRAPQTLPYWAHKRGVKASDGLFMPEPGNEVPDAYSGPTPVTGFILNSKADTALPVTFRVMLEINQNWDWNEYWTNNKYPDDEFYKMSCQPALVYEALVDGRSASASYKMKVIGHSHYSGRTGELFRDLSTITTALNIADSIIVKIGN